jgi:hypothetical protein
MSDLIEWNIKSQIPNPKSRPGLGSTQPTPDGRIALLYVPCRWFAGVKARRRDNWLAYI